MKRFGAGLLLAVILPVNAFAQTPATKSPSREEIIAAARDVMTAARYATLVTIGSDGRPQARIVDPFVAERDLTIWVATNPLTRKAADIKRDGRVTLLYFDAAASEYVTVIGNATLVADSATKAKHWKTDWAAFYKGGPLGGDYLLIRVRPTRLEVVAPNHGVLNDPVTWRPATIEIPNKRADEQPSGRDDLR